MLECTCKGLQKSKLVRSVKFKVDPVLKIDETVLSRVNLCVLGLSEVRVCDCDCEIQAH